MSWPDKERYACPPQSLVVSLLLSLVSILVFFSDRRRTVSKFFDIQVSSFFTEEFILPHRARCVFSRLCSNKYSLLLSSYLSRLAEFRILSAAPADTVPGHLSSHSALSSLGLFAALTLWRLSVSIRFLFEALGSCPASEAPWSSTMPPSLGWGQVKTTITSRSIELKL